MKQKVDSDYITIEVALLVDTYEDLLAGSKVLQVEPDFFVEALISLYSRDFVKSMLRDH